MNPPQAYYMMLRKPRMKLRGYSAIRKILWRKRVYGNIGHMNSQEKHYERLIGLSGPLKVSGVSLELASKRVYVLRCRCPEHGVKTLEVPWAGKVSRFRLLFESFAIQVLQAYTSVQAASDLLGINWHQVNEIKRRTVKRGFERREASGVEHIGIDEKSFRKAHRYVTLLTDIDRSRVLDVAEGRDKAAYDKLFEELGEEQLKEVKAIAMDMWRHFIKAADEHLPEADIVHDKFHVTQHLKQAIYQVRRREHKALSKQKNDTLKNSNYLWLTKFENLSKEMQDRFKELQALELKVGRAIQETFQHFCDYQIPGYARRYFKQWYGWAWRNKLEPVSFENIITYLNHLISNAATEGFNYVIQSIKANARGFRSFENYRVRSYFNAANLAPTLIPHKNLRRPKLAHHQIVWVKGDMSRPPR